MKKAAVELVFTAEEFDLSVITEDYIRHILRKKKLTVQSEGPSVDITICKIDEEALKALLEKCELGHYLEKFQCIQVMSASQLLSNLTDLAFMQRLVQATGLTATEAIQLQILASKQ